MQRATHSHIKTGVLPSLVAAMAPLLLAPSFFASAGESDIGRRSLIHRPPSQSSPPSRKPESISSQSNSGLQSAPPTPPSLPLHHKLKKKPATMSSTFTPTASVAPTGASQFTTSSLATVSAPVEPASGTQAKTLTEAPPKPVATPLSLSSMLGAVSQPVRPSRAASVVQSVTAASSSNASPQLPGSMQRLIQASPSFAALLQTPTPVIAPSPSPPPASPPQSTPTTGSATLTWTANRETDIAGYKIYVGTASGTYAFSGSPFAVGQVTSYTVTNLPYGTTYFFAISAYDSAGNESPLSAEVSKSIF